MVCPSPAGQAPHTAMAVLIRRQRYLRKRQPIAVSSKRRTLPSTWRTLANVLNVLTRDAATIAWQGDLPCRPRAALALVAEEPVPQGLLRGLARHFGDRRSQRNPF